MQLKVVNQALAFGIAGEFYTNQPQRTRGFYLNTYKKDGAPFDYTNIIGNVVFHNVMNDLEVGHYDGEPAQGDVAGILGFPKNVYRYTLDPVGFVSSNQQVEVIQQGYVVVNLHGSLKAQDIKGLKNGENPFRAQIGDYIYYHKITGELTSISKDTPVTAASSWKRLSGATIAVMSVQPPAPNMTNIGVIYMDLAGDKSGIAA